MFEWQELYLTSERTERVRHSSCQENIKFISSSLRVMHFLLYFRSLSEDSRRFFKIVPKARRTFPDIFRTFPKIAKDDRRRSEDVSIIH